MGILISVYIITSHVDGDVIGNRKTDVIVRSLACEIRSVIRAPQVGKAESVAHPPWSVALRSGIHQSVIFPPSHFWWWQPCNSFIMLRSQVQSTIFKKPTSDSFTTQM